MTEIDQADVAIALEAQWRRWIRRYSWHLDQVPGLFEAMRADVVPLGAVDYGRIAVDVSRDGVPVPFRVDVVDAIDELWASLVEYAENVAELLDAPLPEVARWRVRDAVFGVRVGGDTRGESFALIGWLIERVEDILPLSALSDSEEHLFTLIRSDSKRFMSPKPEQRRRCRVCGAGQIIVRWTRSGEISECDRCGDAVQLDVPPPRSLACADGAHGGCDSLGCLCSCHRRTTSLYTLRAPRVPVPLPVVVPALSASCAHSEWAMYVDETGRHCGGCGVPL